MTALNSSCFIQSRFGSEGNFEVIVAGRNRQLRHFTRDNDNPALPWSVRPTIAPGEFLGTSLIQSNFGTPGLGNFELVARQDDKLLHFWRADVAPFTWSGASLVATGVSGTPALIQSRFGAKGNFELVVPLVTGGLGHYWRDNRGPLTWHGPNLFATGLDIRGAALIESSFGNPGNLEVVATATAGVNDSVVHFWRDDQGWHGPQTINLPPAFTSSGLQSVPGFIQGVDGNFEVVIGGGGTLKHVRRDNAGPAQPWIPVVTFAGRPATVYGQIGLIQSNYGPAGSGNLEVMARKSDPGPGVVHLNHYWRSLDPASSWQGPGSDLFD